jgi:hypothetical protein
MPDAPAIDLRKLADPPPRQDLISALQGAGQQPLSLAGPRGETILMLPHGGRILGLYSPQSDENFLWTSATISSAKLAGRHFASEKWRNSGGDRTWLAPEIDFFYPHYPDTARQYFQPRELDPGQYAATVAQSRITVVNNLTIRSFRRGWTAQLRITKTVEVANDPLTSSARRASAEQVEFAGYRLHTSLELLDASSDQVEVGLWNLLQLPGGGEMLVPTYRSTKPIVYFGDIPAGDLRSDDRCVRYRMSAPDEQKIGVDALAVAGRAGYFREAADGGVAATLVVRNFTVDPFGPYVDVPLHSPELGGHAFQACNIDVDYLGRFAELEYHAPAIGRQKEVRRTDDVSQVWAYRGRRQAIAEAAMELLGVAL